MQKRGNVYVPNGLGARGLDDLDACAYDAAVDIMVDGAVFTLLDPGDDPLEAAVLSLQAVACATIHPRHRLAYGLTDSRASARLLAAAVAVAYQTMTGVEMDADEIAGEWARRYGHDLAALDAIISASDPPRNLTPEEIVDGM